MQSECYEAGYQQRCAGHDEAHCHSGIFLDDASFGAPRIPARRMATQMFKLLEKAAGRPSAIGRPAVAKTSVFVAAQRGPKGAQALEPLVGRFVTPLNCDEDTP